MPAGARISWGSMISAWANLSTGCRQESAPFFLTNSFGQSVWYFAHAPSSRASRESAKLLDLHATTARSPIAPTIATLLRLTVSSRFLDEFLHGRQKRPGTYSHASIREPSTSQPAEPFGYALNGLARAK